MDFPIQIKYVRKGTGKYTMVTNFESLSSALGKPSSLVRAFLQAKLEPQKCQLLKDGRFVVSSKLGQTFVKDIVAEFAQHFVVCSKCFSRDTSLRSTARDDDCESPALEPQSKLFVNCNACGAETRVRHSLKTRVIEALAGESEYPQPEQLYPEMSSSSYSSSHQQPQEDVIEEDIKQVTTEMLSVKRAGRPSLQEACERLREYASTNPETVLYAAQDIVAEYDLSSIELVPLLWFTMVKQASHYRSAIERHASLFRDAAYLLVPYDASLLVLGCVEESLCTDDEGLRKTAIKAVPRMLRTLFEQGVLDADTIVGWLDGSVKAVGSDLMGESLVPVDIKAEVVKRSGHLLWAIREENPHVLPKVMATDTDSVDFEYLKLDLIKTKPMRPAPRQRTGDRSTTGWQDLEEEEDTIGNDWTFLEDALS